MNNNIDIAELLVDMFEENDISYNGTIAMKLGNYIEELIESGTLANPCPDFADNFRV